MGKIVIFTVAVELSDEIINQVEYCPSTINAELHLDNGMGITKVDVLDLSISENCYIDLPEQDPTIQ